MGTLVPLVVEAAISKYRLFLWYDRKDLEQQAMISLIRSLHNYNPSKGKLFNWVTLVTVRELRHYINRERKRFETENLSIDAFEDRRTDYESWIVFEQTIRASEAFSIYPEAGEEFLKRARGVSSWRQLPRDYRATKGYKLFMSHLRQERELVDAMD